MKPGEIIPAAGEIELNAGRQSMTLTVSNTGDRPVQVGSHFHFAEANSGLDFDREAAKGFRLDIPSGTAIRFEPGLRTFFYLPFEHSECLSDQHRCVRLIHSLGNLGYLDYAIVHREIIRRFGRFPHRNAVLGRHSGPAEQAFLDEGGFSG